MLYKTSNHLNRQYLIIGFTFLILPGFLYAQNDSPSPVELRREAWRASRIFVYADESWKSHAHNIMRFLSRYSSPASVVFLDKRTPEAFDQARGPLVVMVQSLNFKMLSSNGEDPLYLIARWFNRAFKKEDIPLRVYLNIPGQQKAFYAILPNPWSPHYPLFLLLGDPQTLLVSGPPLGDVEIYDKHMRIFTGFFKSTGFPWIIDTRRTWHFTRGKPLQILPYAGVDLHHVRLSSHQIDELKSRIRRVNNLLESMIGPPRGQWIIHFYPFNEDKVIFSGNSQPATCFPYPLQDKHRISTDTESNTLGEIHAVWSTHPLLQFETLVALVYCRLVYHFGRPEDERLADVVARALVLKAFPDMQTVPGNAVHVLLRDKAYRDQSVRSLMQNPALSRRWRQWIGSFWFLREFEALNSSNRLFSWKTGEKWLNSATTADILFKQTTRYTQNRRRPSLCLPYLRGVTLAHTGYRVFDGYLSRQAEEALKTIKTWGFNAVAVVPYTFMRDPSVPQPLVVPEFPGGENDLSIIHAILASHRQGLKVMLKPQVWLHRSWPGAIRFENPKDAKKFFHFYRPWILHYALMAEQMDVDILAIGTEFRHLTRDYPDAWVDLLRDVRAIYHGYVTYAANWTDEFESIRFWSMFDFVGVNGYANLSSKQQPTDEDLNRGAETMFQRIRRVADRVRRPVILTEWGYPSRPLAWHRPYEESETRDDDAQARCYQVVFPVLIKNLKFVRGFFIWKWPTTGRENDHRHRFSPLNPATSKVVRRWLKRLEENQPDGITLGDKSGQANCTDR